MEHDPTHHFALITTPEYLPKIVDTEHIPLNMREMIHSHKFPEAIHMRCPARASITLEVQSKKYTIPLPAGCYSTERSDQGIRIIQPAVFGEDASPELAYLISILWQTYQIPYIIATSANVHGTIESSVFHKGEEVRQQDGQLLPYLNVGTDHAMETIPFSFAGIEVHLITDGEEDTTQHVPIPLDMSYEVFREGHLHLEIIRLRMGSAKVRKSANMKRSPHTYHPTLLEETVLMQILRFPSRLHLPILKRVNDYLFSSNEETTSP